MSSKRDKNVRRVNELSKVGVKLDNTFTAWHHSVKSTFLKDLKDSPHVTTSLKIFDMWEES